MRRLPLIAALALLISGGALAHDFWIAPTKLRARPGDLIGIHLQIGHPPDMQSFPRSESRFEKFVCVGPAGDEHPVPGREYGYPAGIIRVTDPGLYLVGYRSTATPITLEASKFETYLQEEGLDGPAATRAARGESSKEGREKFSRAAKSLIAVGDHPETGTGYDRVLGFKLELIAEANPYALKAGDELPLRLVYDGKPLENAQVKWLRGEEPTVIAKGRTDKEGRVRAKLEKDGYWLIASVHMVATDGKEADWESVWATLTFELGTSSPPAAPVVVPAAGATGTAR
jgi:uncharacterized GH25 family protein